jgi:hypothetical protein
MWSIFRWINKDRAGQERAKRAVADAELITEKIDREIQEDVDTAHFLRGFRTRNHLAELFDEAFSARRKRQGEGK